MSPTLARPLLHTIHLLTVVVLFATGLLLFIPGLRAVVTGGYSLQIRAAHRWGGVAFVILPAVVIVAAGVRHIFRAPARRTLGTLWQGLHTGITILFAFIFVVTGFALWAEPSLPEALVDHSRSVHDWLTYAAAVLVLLHLAQVGAAALVARFTAAAAVRPSHLQM